MNVPIINETLYYNGRLVFGLSYGLDIEIHAFSVIVHRDFYDIGFILIVFVFILNPFNVPSLNPGIFSNVNET